MIMVDSLEQKKNRNNLTRKFCQLFTSNPENIPLLHDFAKGINVDIGRFVDDCDEIPKYDITERERRRSLNRGATEVVDQFNPFWLKTWKHYRRTHKHYNESYNESLSIKAVMYFFEEMSATIDSKRASIIFEEISRIDNSYKGHNLRHSMLADMIGRYLNNTGNIDVTDKGLIMHASGVWEKSREKYLSYIVQYTEIKI